MSSSQRRNSAGLIGELLERPQRFGFFQAVRLLERWLESSSSAASHRHSGLLSPRLSFRNSLSLSFAAGEVEALSVLWRESAATDAGADRLIHDAVEAVEITPAFIGLLGASGTLPLHYTELIAQREWLHRDTSARAFLDVFTHRAVSLFYSAWKKHRLHVQYESDRRDRFLPLILALSGLGQRGLRDRLEPCEGGVPDEAVAYFAGAAQRRPVSAVQLRGLLQGYLGVPVRIDQFVGRWYTLPTDAATSLGLGNGVLGASAIAGERVWQRDLCLRVVLGPLDRERYLRFLPGGAGERALRQWLHLLCGGSFEYEVRLRLRREAVCGIALSVESQTGRLGWDTFLCTAPVTEDREDVVYDLQAA
ncbi:type VI secretion system baseplate subunit TssG [Aquabacterium sp.]|uniref:type VI secretion system baseplate subunit TssG n=1 Tax=Aquabacterium sp. TaxID=1872578 RepID=UPI0035B2C3A0